MDALFQAQQLLEEMNDMSRRPDVFVERKAQIHQALARLGYRAVLTDNVWLLYPLDKKERGEA